MSIYREIPMCGEVGCSCFYCYLMKTGISYSRCEMRTSLNNITKVNITLLNISNFLRFLNECLKTGIYNYETTPLELFSCIVPDLKIEEQSNFNKVKFTYIYKKRGKLLKDDFEVTSEGYYIFIVNFLHGYNRNLRNNYIKMHMNSRIL